VQVSGQVAVETAPSVTRTAGAGEISVSMYRVDTRTHEATLVGVTPTDASGAWSLSVPMGSYFVGYDYIGIETSIPSFYKVASSYLYTLSEAIDSCAWLCNQLLSVSSSGSIGTTTMRQGATLSGNVTASRGHAVLPGQPVAIWRDTDNTWGIWSTTTTDAAGNYAFAGMPNGTFAVEFQGAGGYAQKFARALDFEYRLDPDEGGIGTANVATYWNTHFTNWDGELDRGGNVRGTVTSTSGARLKGIEVSVLFGPKKYAYRTVTTDSNGNYRFDTLPANGYAYLLRFASPADARTKYVTQYYNKSKSTGQAEYVDVTRGNTLYRSAKLVKTGTITGRIQGSGATADIHDDVTIEACRKKSSTTFDCNLPASHLDIDANGYYSLTGLATGEYSMRAVYSGAQALKNQYYGGSSTREKSTLISVRTGSSTGGKNFVLTGGGTISGTVSIDSGSPQGYEVTADPVDPGGSTRSGVTDSAGNYEIGGLSAGRYRLTVTNVSATSNGAAQYYPGVYFATEAEVVQVTGSSALTSYDFNLESTATVSVVVEDVWDQPIPGITAQLLPVYSVTSTHTLLQPATATSDANGNVVLHDIAPGEYRILFSDPTHTYLPMYYNGLLGGTAGDVWPFGVDAGEVLDLSMTMPRSAQYSGTVVSSSGTPVSYAKLEPVGMPDLAVYADAAGDFLLSGVASGHPRVLVSAPNFVTTTVTFDSAILGFTRDVGEIALDRDGQVYGWVTAPNGSGMANVEVWAWIFDAETGQPTLLDTVGLTDSNGKYLINGLPTGSIYLEFVPLGSGRYAPQFLGGAPDIYTATPLEFATPDYNENRSFRFGPSGSISGKITSTTGAALENVPVIIEDVTGMTTTASSRSPLPSTMTDSHGKYTIDGLTAGTYRISVNASSTQDHRSNYTAPIATMTLSDGAQLHYNARLSPYVTVSGEVRDANGAGLPFMTVSYLSYNPLTGIASPAENAPASITSDAIGRYRASLPPGIWVLKASDPNNLYSSRYLGGGESPQSANTTRVVVGTKALSGKNIVLPSQSRVTGTVLTSDGDPSATGTITIERVENGTVVATEELGVNTTTPLNQLLPLPALADGSYRIHIAARATVPPLVVPVRTVEFTILGTQLSTVDGVTATGTSLGTIVLDPAHGKATPHLENDFPVLTAPANPTVGDEVSTTEGEWNVELSPDQLTIQWMRDTRPIAGARGVLYIIKPGDVGHSVSANFYLTNSDGSISLVRQTESTATITPGPAPILQVDPFVTGTPKPGFTLTAHAGEWSANNHASSFAWIRTAGTNDPVVVSSVSSYTVTADDAQIGTTLTLRETRSRAGFDEATADVDILLEPALSPIKTIAKPKVTHSNGVYSISPGSYTSGSAWDWSWVIYDSSTGLQSTTINGGQLDDATVGTNKVEVRLTVTKSGYADLITILPVHSGPRIETTGQPQLPLAPVVGFAVAPTETPVPTPAAGTTWTYQWYRGATKIAGATHETYTPTTSDVGKSISVRMIPKNPGFLDGTAVTSTASIVMAAGPFTGGTFAIEGTASVGRVISVTASVPFVPAPSSVKYQWYRVVGSTNVAISGATAASRKLDSHDLGRTLVVRISASRSGYASTSTLISTDPITALPVQSLHAPVLVAPASVGSPMSVKDAQWDISGVALEYQWRVNGVAILGATTSSYTPGVRDLDEDISVSVRAGKTGIASSHWVISNAVTVESGTAPALSSAPKLTLDRATPTFGATVSAEVGTWRGGSGTINHLWQVDRHDGSGFSDMKSRTSSSLSLYSGDPSLFAVGWTYRVCVTISRAGYRDSTPVCSTGITQR
jgi:hypothetical protein